MNPVRSMVLVGALALFSGSAVAQSGSIDGQVVKVDQSAGKITLKHGPILKLGMEQGMTMVFKAQDPAMLKALKAGDKVKFEAAQVNGQFTVTAIAKSK